MALDPKLTKFSTASPVIASFTSTNLITGAGELILYTAQVVDSVSTRGVLLTSTERSAVLALETVNGDSTETNYDASPFPLAQTANGTAFLSFSSNDDGVGGTMDWTIQLYKVQADDTEVALHTAITRSTTQSTTETEHLYEIELTPTLFEVGSKVRLSITVDSSNSADTFYGTDPANRTYTSILAQTLNETLNKLVIPFEVFN